MAERRSGSSGSPGPRRPATAREGRGGRAAAPAEGARSGRPASWLGLVLRLLAAAVWLVAGIAKLPELQSFRYEVGRYLLLPHVLVTPFAYVLPFLEIGVGLYLAAGLFVRGSAFVGTLLMAAFLVAQAQAWARGLSLDCGCFGSLAKSSVGPLTILRDLLLGLPTFVMLALPARRWSLDGMLFHGEDRFARRLSRRKPTGATPQS